MSSEIRSADGKSGLRFTNMLLLALCLALLSPPVFGQGKPDEAQANRKWNIRRVERLKDYKDHKGKVRPDLWKKGVEHAESVNISAGVSRVPPGSAKADGPPSIAAAPITGVQWVQRGPQPAFPIEGIAFQGNGAMSGEVVDAVIDPRGLSDDVIYIVSNDGGVWRSTDGGVTFEPKTDNMPSLSMGAITLDPVNPSVVYAGTGNLFDGSSQNTLLAVKAVGIYRSIDMGESWAVINPNNMFDGVGIARMAMPAANTLLVATPSGLFKSVNGGMSFGTAPLYNDGAPVLGGDVEDLDLDVTVPTTVYASVNGSGGGSTNGGFSYRQTPVTPFLPTYLPTGTVHRMTCSTANLPLYEWRRPPRCRLGCTQRFRKRVTRMGTLTVSEVSTGRLTPEQTGRAWLRRSRPAPRTAVASADTTRHSEWTHETTCWSTSASSNSIVRLTDLRLSTPFRSR